MRRILKRPELVEDTWRYLGEEASDSDALVIPFAEFQKDPAKWNARSGSLGVRLTSADAVEPLEQYLARFSLVAVEFPNVGDGRGFSLARLLRARLHFTGELRATGPGVKQDKIFLLARCGFDEFELPPEENAEEARRALGRYDVAYQPAEPLSAIRRQRYFA